MQSQSSAARSLTCALLLLTACRSSPAPPASAATIPTRRDSIAAERDSLVRIVRALIAGREAEPATQVFKNVKVLTENVSAANLVNAMAFYGTALGVSCSHCHVVGDWPSEQKPKKAVARSMMRMNGVINGQLLKEITGLRSANPTVNCITCHRGQIVPARSLTGAR